jgi:tryptophanyl-tRNA synthetase
MSRQVILTGIRANNDLTIGNYFGAIMPIIDMAKNKSDEYQINLFVPDLHSFTTPVDHSMLQEQIMHNLRLFVASGLLLDNTNVHIYRQSFIPAHSELTWILDCFTGFGEMSRMTQFKEKSGLQESLSESTDSYLKDMGWNEQRTSKARDLTGLIIARNKNVSLGLFNYPVLMASDILLYGATYVPVGDDQTQHLEFTRDIAERMNNKFLEELFTIPKPVKEQHEFFGKDQGLRIKDLQDPTKKMSKSDDSGKGVIFLGDSPELASKKIMSAATDSVGVIKLDWENQPGISNLLQILALLKNIPLNEIVSEWSGKSSYGDLKTAVSEAVSSFLFELQSNLALVNDSKVKTKLELSERAMNDIAKETLLKVQKAVGLR